MVRMAVTIFIEMCLGKGSPAKEGREKAAVVVSGLSNKDEHTAQENSEVEADHENNVKETVEQIKYLETMKVFDVKAKPKSEPEEHIESIRDTATIQLWLLFTIYGDAAQRSTEPATLL